MKATRRTQPYRRGVGRAPGETLGAMLAGKPRYMANPQDISRKTQRMARRRRKPGLRRVRRYKPS